MGNDRNGKKSETGGESLDQKNKRISNLFPGLRRLPKKKKPAESESDSEHGRSIEHEMNIVRDKPCIPDHSPEVDETTPVEPPRTSKKAHDPIRQRLTISLPKVNYSGEIKINYTCTCGVPHDIVAPVKQKIETNSFCDVCGRKYVLKVTVHLEGK